jgi:cytochrome P450
MLRAVEPCEKQQEGYAVSDQAEFVIPAHVPRDRVRSFPLKTGRITDAPPHDLLTEVHAGPPIIWSQDTGGSGGASPGYWIPRRVPDLERVYADNVHFSANAVAPYAALIGESWRLIPQESDPPFHVKIRSALLPHFSATRMAALEDKIRAYARDSIRAFRDRGSCELVSEFSFRFPIQVFLELLGLPLEETERFLHWEHMITQSADATAVAQTTREICDYFAEVCEARRKVPRDDLISFGVHGQVEGRKLTRDELTGFCFMMFVAGLDTVSANIGLQVRHLAEHPEHQAFLRANPEQIPRAIEEMMRAYPAATTARVCIVETQIADMRLKPGDLVMMCTPLAGRDPETYPEPEQVRFDREMRHVSFGSGHHHCLGVHLARRELRIALEELLGMLPPFEIAPGAVVRSYIGWLVQPVELPLVWRV